MVDDSTAAEGGGGIAGETGGMGVGSNILVVNFSQVSLSVAGGQRLAIASRTAGTTSCAQRFSVVLLRLSPGGSK